MNKKDPNTDSGKYVNGIYSSKNGYTNSGLNCPKGTRLYDTSAKQVVFFEPEDTEKGEEFRKITQDVAPDILPYYAVSNYGRVLNTRSGKIMKPNYRPNGYEYFCLAAENCKNGQKKYSTHRIVLKTFDPVDNMDELQVNHIYGDKTKNYINKIMEDGTYDTAIEWCTPKENCIHRENNNLSVHNKLNMDEANNIRKLHDEGYSYNQIVYIYNNGISSSTVEHICKNKIYKDESYTPKPYNDCYKNNPANLHRLTDDDANSIRDLYKHGYTYYEIKDKFYPEFSICAISDIIRNKTHNRDN